MKRGCLLVLAVLFLVATGAAASDGGDLPLFKAPELTANIPANSPNPCARLQLVSFEHIDPQGFLGLGTPKARASAVGSALKDNILLAWKGSEAREHPDQAMQLLSSIPDDFGVRDPLLLMGYDFQLYQLCTLASNRGLRRLTFACRADTRDVSDDPVDKPSGFLGSYKSHSLLFAECVISTYDGSKADWETYLRYAWGKPQNNSSRMWDAGDIDFERSRELEYYRLLRGLVNLVSDGRHD